MDDDSKFWLGIWKLVAVCFCVFVFSATACVTHDSYRRSQLLENAADPIAVRCGFDGVSEKTAAICATIAARR